MTAPVITTRAEKGIPLSFQEVDDNFTNLRDAITGLQTDAVTQNLLATEPEARAGVVNNKWMSPLRTAQAIDSLGGGVSLGVVLALGG